MPPLDVVDPPVVPPVVPLAVDPEQVLYDDPQALWAALAVW